MSVFNGLVQFVGEAAKLVSRFSLWHKRRKEKRLQKRNAEDISPSAEGEEGFAPSTAQAFEKA